MNLKPLADNSTELVDTSYSNFSMRTPINVNLYLFLFLFLWFFAQLTFESAPVIGFFLVGCATVVLASLLFSGNRNDLFFFLFITTAMNIIIPFSPQRELKLLLPSIFLLTSVIRFAPKFLRVQKGYFRPIFISVSLFLILALIGVFNGVKIPGINALPGENSGLLNRFNLLNSIIVFICGLILFDSSQSERWVGYFFRFYIVILVVSFFVIVFELGTFPFFNTFTWSLILENEGSKKMAIAGVSACFILICTLTLVTDKRKFWFLILFSIIGLVISGSRISFLAGLLMIFVSFVLRRKILGKSFIVLIFSMFIAFYLLLSPIILLVPEKYQRLVIVFPPQYYTGELSHLSKSAAASSSSFRQEIWSRASIKISDHPFFGNSFDAPKADYNFGTNLMEGFKKIPTEVLYNDFLVTGSLHNTFFGIAYLLGIPSLFLFTVFLFRLTWLHYKMSMLLSGVKRRVSLFISILLINYIVYGLVADLIFDLQFFLIAAIAIKILFFYYNKEGLIIKG